MIYETKTNYYAEWIDEDSVVNNRYIGSTVEEMTANSHKIREEEQCYPFIIEERIERRVIMQKGRK